MAEFVHLRLHTEYSLLRSTIKIDSLIAALKKKNMKAAAITDFSNMFGAVHFFKKAKENGIKPIIGCEISLEGSTEGGSQSNLVLLIKNDDGYKNLIKLISQPKISIKDLESRYEGLICLSGFMRGPIESAILRDPATAKKRALYLKKIFGEDFYIQLELNSDSLDSQILLSRALINLARELNIQLVSTNDVHYLESDDAIACDILQCIGNNNNYRDKDREKLPGNQLYLKSQDEMIEAFKQIPEAIENTIKIANACNFEFDFDTLHLPKFYKQVDLREYTLSEFEKIIGTPKLDHDRNDCLDRLNLELDIIYKMGYEDYILIVQDFIKSARQMGISVGPGRGSAGGSLVCYTLGITQMDPIKHNLIFERFLNPERVTMPDIDVDFEDELRHKVIDYVKSIYGDQNVAQIITFGTLAAKSVIRDVARVMDLPYYAADKMAKLIPSQLGITLEQALSKSSALARLLENDPKSEYVYRIAKKLEGLPRHASTHAAGVVITGKGQPVDSFVPLYMGNTTQYTMNDLASLGLIKMDFLGIRTLTVIKKVVNRLKCQGKEVDPNTHSPAVYRLISSGRTIGIFQLESEGFRNFIRQLAPDCIKDIIAAISLYRPGPMASIPKYIQNKRTKKIEYATPELEPILSETYGILIYQEQVMRIARDLAGYTYGRSDILRDAMGKKKMAIMEKERKIFINGCSNNGISPKVSNKLFDDMTEFAKYAFNKTHATGYAMLAYQGAYLKTHYQIEYMTELLSSVINMRNLLDRYLAETRRLRIKILPPDINMSFEHFETEENAIRFSLVAIKNVGKNIANAIVKERKEAKFKSFQDFIERMSPGNLNKKAIESLILSGCFDSFGNHRTQLMGSYEWLLAKSIQTRKLVGDRQLSLFTKNFVEPQPLGNIKEFAGHRLREYELELLGIAFRSSASQQTPSSTDAKIYLRFKSREETQKVTDFISRITKSKAADKNYRIIYIVDQAGKKLKKILHSSLPLEKSQIVQLENLIGSENIRIIQEEI